MEDLGRRDHERVEHQTLARECGSDVLCDRLELHRPTPIDSEPSDLDDHARPVPSSIMGDPSIILSVQPSVVVTERSLGGPDRRSIKRKGALYGQDDAVIISEQ